MIENYLVVEKFIVHFEPRNRSLDCSKLLILVKMRRIQISFHK